MNDQIKNKEDKREFSLDRAFLAMELLPNAADSYTAQVRDINNAVKDSDVVLDTNVLLLPYGAGSDSLKAITKIFETLTAENRLHLPAQVIREFIKNRPTKIAELYKGISDKVSRIQAPQKLSYPIFEEIDDFLEINDILKTIGELTKKLQRANGGLLKKIRNWEWNDPVSLAYREKLPASIIVELQIDREETLAELQRRYELSIPPGYKDSGKDDFGIGDFLIWKTILDIGSTNKKDMIFVSGDEKSDWQHRSDGAAFLPRYELLDEYRRSSDGRALYIIPLSKLLELLDVADASVEEIKQEEARIVEATTIDVTCPYCDSSMIWRLGDSVGSSEVPRCTNCENRFHIHRTRDGVIVHKAADGYRQKTELKDKVAISMDCPSCDEAANVMLGVEPNSTAWARCANCATTFPVHRRPDGTVFVGNINV